MITFKRLLLYPIFYLITLTVNSQCIDSTKAYPTVVTDKLYISFNLYKTDTILIGIYDHWGSQLKKIIYNEILSAGHYTIETNVTGLKEGSHYLLFSCDDHKHGRTIMKMQTDTFVSFPDRICVQLFDTLYKTITDTQHVVVFDTLTIVDTLKLMVIDTIPTSFVDNENIVINNSTDFIYNGVLDLGDSDADYFELFELSGKLVVRAKVKNSQIVLKNLTGTLYIIVLYKNGEVIKSSRLLRN